MTKEYIYYSPEHDVIVVLNLSINKKKEKLYTYVPFTQYACNWPMAIRSLCYYIGELD